MIDEFIYKSLLLDIELLNKYVNQKAITYDELQNVIEKHKLEIDVETFAKFLSLSEDVNKNGLYVGFHRIDRLSGPSSFSLLTPETLDLPIIMLFGDSHNTNEYQCEKCSCSLNSLECCLRTFDDKFLKNLDLLSSREHPVDIYVEGFSSNYDINKNEFAIDSKKQHLNLENKVDHQMFMMKLNYFKCFDDIRKFDKEDPNYKLYEKYCPTKFIRWNFADPRVTERDNILETKIFTLIRSFLNSNFNVKTIERHPIFHLIQRLIFIPNDFVNSILNDKNSLLQHEFSQIPESIKEKVIESLVKYIDYLHSTTEDFEELKLALSLKSTRLNNFEIFIRLTNLTSFITEIYSFLRMLQSSPRPWLQVMIFGHRHCENFIHFLVNIFGKYKIRLNLGTENVILDFKNNKLTTTSQCIEFNKEKVHLAQLYQEIYGSELVLNYRQFNNTFVNKYSSIHNIRNYYLGFDFVNLIESNKISISKVKEILDKKYSDVNTKNIISNIIRLKELENEINLFYQMGKKLKGFYIWAPMNVKRKRIIIIMELMIQELFG